VAPCVWGDRYGAALKAGGASIPARSTAKGFDDLSTDEEIGHWQALYSDPLCELRVWALRPAEMEPFDPLGRKTPQQLFDEHLQAMTLSSELREALHLGGISDEDFYAARRTVAASPAYVEALNSTSQADLSEFAATVARAIVATLIAGRSLPPEAWVDDEDLNVVSADIRDHIVLLLTNDLWSQSKGLASNLLTRAVSALGTRYLTGSRTIFCSALVPYIGDILLYQGSGKPIRDLIHSRIAGCEPPIVLLAHSLGGVACVELLAAESLPEVALLVTVGSQAPFFYEMDALTSLRFGERLPDHFPRWLNIYDCCDFLSFIGASVFPEFRRLEDVEVNNRQPFPWSHISYWSNSQTWDAIFARLPRERQ
jgi:hypothetical protein